MPLSGSYTYHLHLPPSYPYSFFLLPHSYTFLLLTLSSFYFLLISHLPLPLSSFPYLRCVRSGARSLCCLSACDRGSLSGGGDSGSAVPHAPSRVPLPDLSGVRHACLCVRLADSARCPLYHYFRLHYHYSNRLIVTLILIIIIVMFVIVILQ